MKTEVHTSEDNIIIRGAKEHNLKNVSLSIPKEKFVVITGPSGSGKSSLAFDTIFAEAQRRYMESLSAYARQFLDQLNKPAVDFIDGLSPSISIEQKTISNHPRSSVGTITGIYDFLRLLFARMGVVKDPVTGEALKAHTDEDVLNFISELPKGEKVEIYASVVRGKKGEFLREFEAWRRTGFTKVRIDGAMRDLFDPILISRYQQHDIDLLLDKVTTGKEDTESKVLASLKHADRISGGWLRIASKSQKERIFSRKIASATEEFTFPEIEPRLFSFNSPYGMCLSCKGLGLIEQKLKKPGIKAKNTEKSDDDENSEEDRFKTCESCSGKRLRKEALWVYFEDLTIDDWVKLSASEFKIKCDDILKKKNLHPVVLRIITEIRTRLAFLENVGVGYLSCDRRSSTLSGGEAQRIRLATQLGSELSGVLYVLDEPSIGLHPRDHKLLLNSLTRLRDLGNTVLVVEHDEDTMLASDYLIDVGPAAGVHGGVIIAQGPPDKVLKNKESVTGNFLSGNTFVSEQRKRRTGNNEVITISGCRGHNLNNVDLSLPLGKFVVFTGVSGSGKSSLVKGTLETALSQKFYRSLRQALPFKKLQGTEHINKVVNVNQRAIGRTPRSNPATYTGIFTALRTIFSQTPDAKIRGYLPGSFSFNVKGGRCDACEGAGRKKIEMHFLPDVYITCETCNGTRYRREILDVRFKGLNIAQCLSMTVEEAYEHFKSQPLIEPKLKTLMDVGLHYVQLGQSSTTLSGGEAQRIKLAKELSKKATGKTLYFLDEPTTGLHFNDVKKLLELLQKLCDQGNTVAVIEHNLDVIASADWIVDIGPDAGHKGGQIVFEGSPEKLLAVENSATRAPLKEYFERRNWKF